MMTLKEETNINKSAAVASPSAPSAEDMVKAGVHFGHRTTKWNPKMEQYLFGVKNSVHIINLEKTVEKLKAAMDFAAEVAARNGVILFVGTGPAASGIAKEAALKAGMPYVSERWLGGTLTNFKIISKRLDYYRDLENKRDTGELKKYTKKEQHDFDEELKKLDRKFGGVKNLKKIPEAIFVLDPKKNMIAVSEANQSGVKVIALCDTNSDPTVMDYPIPSNDDAAAALELMANAIVSAIEEGKKQAQNPTVA